MKNVTKKLAYSAVIAAVYAVLTLVLYPLSFSGAQVRISEALTLLPLLMPESVIGLTVGCLIANLFGNGPLDVILGTLATLISALLTAVVGRKIKSTPLKLSLGCIPPVIINAVIVPFTFLAMTELKEAYVLSAASVGLGQLISVCAVGIPLYYVLRQILTKTGYFTAKSEKNMKKIAILINAYMDAPGYMLQCNRIKDELVLLGAEATVIRNDGFLSEIVGGETVVSFPYDACVYLDKDKYVSKMLEDCGVKLFNSHAVVRACDDKMITHITLSGHGIAMPKTLPGLLCYDRNAPVKDKTVALIEEKLGYPVIVKESYGSLGKGVHKADDKTELLALMERLKTTPHLYQQAITESFGRDMRVIVIGGKAIGAMIRNGANGNFRSNIGAGGDGTAVDIPPKFREVAEKAASVLGADYCGVDLMFGNDGPVLCEVNSNAFFDGFERVTGINVAKAYAEHILRNI